MGLGVSLGRTGSLHATLHCVLARTTRYWRIAPHNPVDATEQLILVDDIDSISIEPRGAYHVLRLKA